MHQKCCVLLFVLFWLVALHPARTRVGATEATSQERSPREPQVEQYERALEIRSRRAAPWVLQQKAAELLVAATGFCSLDLGRSFPFNGTLGCGGGSGCEDTVLLEGVASGNASVWRSAHRGALRELAKAFQDGWGVPQDMRLALALFRAASAAGDPEAQGHMGLRYAVGLDQPECWSAGEILGFGQPKPQEALLHYYFGAVGGDMASRMALGYRHLMGSGVPRSCWSAAAYYQPVGEQVSDLAAGVQDPAAPTSVDGGGGYGPSTSTGGRTNGGFGVPYRTGSLPHVERIRLHLQAAQGGLRSDRHREVVQYYQYSADRGNTEAQTAVGQVLNYGTHGVDRDHAAALSYFKLAAEAQDVDAMAHLGAMYANGYGAPQSYDKARDWWQAAAKRHNGVALFGLGYLYLTGRGVEQSYDQAFQYFSKAAEAPSDARPDALFYLGVMHLRGYGVRRKSVQRAFFYFSTAAKMGHVLAQYNAAVMHLAGKGTPRNCKPAVALIKAVAEKGPAAASLQLGHEHFFRGRYGISLLSYLRAADMGLEVAQSNAAWMLERGYVPGANASELAFSLYKQSAAQNNVHSLLCMGDAYFYGRGVEQDWVRSAAVYYEAYQERSAEAMFNLGFMHEFGVGVPRDLALARRFYNMARHTQADAVLPVVLANIWLRLHEWWDLLRPHLPPALDPLWNCVFMLHPPHTSLFGPWVARLQRLLPNLALFHAEVVFWRWVDLTGLSSLGSLIRLEDASESATLLALLGGLALVVRLRRRRAQVRVQQQEAARLLQEQRQQLQEQQQRGQLLQQLYQVPLANAAAITAAAATATAAAATAAGGAGVVESDVARAAAGTDGVEEGGAAAAAAGGLSSEGKNGSGDVYVGGSAGEEGQSGLAGSAASGTEGSGESCS